MVVTATYNLSVLILQRKTPCVPYQTTTMEGPMKQTYPTLHTIQGFHLQILYSYPPKATSTFSHLLSLRVYLHTLSAPRIPYPYRLVLIICIICL